MNTGTHMWTEITLDITITRACFTCPPTAKTSQEVHNQNECMRGVEKESGRGRERQRVNERKIES